MKARLLGLALALLPLQGRAEEHASASAFRGWLAGHHAALVRAAVWRSPTEIERTAIVRGIAMLSRGLDRCGAPVVDAATRVLAEAGLAVVRHRWPGAEVLVVSELVPHGSALVALRCGASLPLLVQAPHSLFDLGTDDMAFAAFAEGGVRGAMWNTVHRYRALPGERPEDKVHPADVTHTSTSAWQSFTLAWTASDPAVRILQIHGFDAARSEATAIASTGVADAPPAAVRAPIARALGVPEAEVLVYGIDAHDLGGTRNVQARGLGVTPHPRFLHLELSRTVRDRLARDPAASVSLARAIAEASWSR